MTTFFVVGIILKIKPILPYDVYDDILYYIHRSNIKEIGIKAIMVETDLVDTLINANTVILLLVCMVHNFTIRNKNVIPEANGVNRDGNMMKVKMQ